MKHKDWAVGAQVLLYYVNKKRANSTQQIY